MNFKKKNQLGPNQKDFFIKNSRVNQYLNERIDKWIIDKKLDFWFWFDSQFFET
jgi:hypothetical protein